MEQQRKRIIWSRNLSLLKHTRNLTRSMRSSKDVVAGIWRSVATSKGTWTKELSVSTNSTLRFNRWESAGRKCATSKSSVKSIWKWTVVTKSRSLRTISTLMFIFLRLKTLSSFTKEFFALSISTGTNSKALLKRLKESLKTHSIALDRTSETSWAYSAQECRNSTPISSQNVTWDRRTNMTSDSLLATFPKHTICQQTVSLSKLITRTSWSRQWPNSYM